MTGKRSKYAVKPGQYRKATQARRKRNRRFGPGSSLYRMA